MSSFDKMDSAGIKYLSFVFNGAKFVKIKCFPAIIYIFFMCFCIFPRDHMSVKMHGLHCHTKCFFSYGLSVNAASPGGALSTLSTSLSL